MAATVTRRRRRHRGRSAVRHGLELAVFRSVYRLLASLPEERALRLGAAAGDLFYRLDRTRRAIARVNLEIAFPHLPEQEREAILRRSCRNLGRSAAEFCHLHRLSPETVRERVVIDDPKAWEEAIDQAHRRGGIVLTGHVGNWELLAYAHGLLGHPVTLVHRAFGNAPLDALVTAIRAGAGTRSVPKHAAARELLRALREGRIIALPADQNQSRRSGVFVPFFGRPACSTPGPARLAMLTGAIVVPAFLLREGDSARHRLVLLPAIDIVRTGDTTADVVENTRRCQAALEQIIRRHPDQWVWFHKRWRTRPDGEPPLYGETVRSLPAPGTG